MVRELTAEMMADIRTPQNPQVSPDGRQIVLSLGHFTRREEHSQADLWLIDVSGAAEPRQITPGIVNETAPTWSPDGSQIAFLADRYKRGIQQLWLMSLEAGGEALPLTDQLGGVQRFAWLPGDQRRIACVIPDARDPEEQHQRKESGDDANVFGDFWPWGRLYILDVESGELQDIDLGNRHVFAMSAAPDGEQLAVVVSERPTLDSMGTTAELVLIDLPSFEVATIAHLGRRCGDLTWSQDGKSLYYLAPAGPVPVVSSNQIWSVDAAANSEPRLVTSDLRACVVGLSRPSDSQQLLAIVHQGVESDIYQLDPASDSFEPLQHIEGDAQSISASTDGQILTTTIATPVCPYEVYAGSPAGELDRRSTFQSDFEDVELGPSEVVTWERAGFTLDGVLLYPPGKSRADGPLPTAVSLHGGPYGRWAHAFSYPRPFAHWLAAQGYLVFMPNPRGGLGHGEAFASAVLDSVGGQDWQDILAGIDKVVDEGIVDPSQMGVGGWSQGGFMTAWAIGHDPDDGPRFRCAIMGAGVSDWGMMVATSDVPTFEQRLGGGNPFEGPGPHSFDRWSPISYVHRARTPTLILHGERDERVPLSQAIFMHRGLERYGVETEFVSYPREPHGLQERQHVIDLHQRVADWYRHWIPLDEE